jgi:hypothetical protein
LSEQPQGQDRGAQRLYAGLECIAAGGTRQRLMLRRSTLFERRLHCDARHAVASQNSLRELRSLRSNNCDESVHDAR